MSDKFLLKFRSYFKILFKSMKFNKISKSPMGSRKKSCKKEECSEGLITVFFENVASVQIFCEIYQVDIL